MARINYSYTPEDESKAAKAMGYEMPISFKHAVEICRELKGKKIDEAINYLEDVIAMKRAVPFRKYKKKVAHKSGLEKWYAGRYPQKAAKHILKVLKNLEANAEYKGLETDRLVIVHAQAKKGRVLKRYMPRAFGRATPRFKVFTTVEFVAEVR
ncbi:50S ribosomal protein L22 [Archaeoglobus veneficus]|uniref:Large ribosomal subunit protein uL22 n=1 Tax=Archaeoglobus veneficus (strain DSM 11195 / SNP6) TaxID=693661 RepID=F2KSU6_ARCVS|nr:50S ribosomal protein L22 [Archaeoglobus veneficus]AEA46991.1 ribosomal protein L22 [Archaeoglobus veneficus SNP6]